MIEAFVELLRRYRDSGTDAVAFQQEYLSAWRQLRDYDWLSPKSKEIAIELTKEFLKSLDQKEFLRKFEIEIPESQNRDSIKPFSQEAVVIDNLFYVVEAFPPDGPMRDPIDTTLEELDEAVNTALERLLELNPQYR